MLQVAHRPSIGQNFHEPRSPPTAPPTSPTLRQHIVHLIKTTKPEQLTVNLPRNERVRRPLIANSVNKPIDRSIVRHEFDDVNRRTPATGLRKEIVDLHKGRLEKQTSTLSNGSIRRLPLRSQRQITSLSTKQDPIKVDKENKENVNLNQSNSSSENKESSAGNSCEIKGSAIKNSTSYVATQKKRMEIHKKTQKFSASLNEFKRRLMMNQGKFYKQPEAQAEQYKISPTTAQPAAVPPLQPHPPSTPKLSYFNNPLSRRPSNEGIRPSTHDFNEIPEVSHRPTYRLPLREATQQIHPVETYVLVQNQRERIRGKFDEPITLTSHNLSMHNMFIEMDERKMKDSKSAANIRVHKWLEKVQSSAIRPHRSVRFNIMSDSSSSSAGDSESS